MLFKPWACFALAGFAAATPMPHEVKELQTRSTQDTPSMRAAMAAITTAVQNYDTALKQLTADNTTSTLKDLNTKAHALGRAMEIGAKAVSSTPPLKGIQDAIGLITPTRAYATALNQTALDLATKIDIIQKSNQTALVVDALKAQKPGLIAFSAALMTQIPASMRSSIPPSFKMPSDAQLNGLLDELIDQTGAILDGKAKEYSIPPSLPGIALEMGLLPGFKGRRSEIPMMRKHLRV